MQCSVPPWLFGSVDAQLVYPLMIPIGTFLDSQIHDPSMPLSVPESHHPSEVLLSRCRRCQIAALGNALGPRLVQWHLGVVDGVAKGARCGQDQWHNADESKHDQAGVHDGYKNYVAYKQANISYFGAWQTCRLYGGHLASIESADENARVVATIKAAGNSAKEWYIGLTDMGIEGRFIWIGLNKELNSMSYNNWNTGEPNNVGNEDCTVIGSDAAVGGPGQALLGSFASQLTYPLRLPTGRLEVTQIHDPSRPASLPAIQ
uniref:C-type lectin domain-containing protein n=1 Tax=Anopheles farauti TaxID=69004 RepID=A0A182Q365_9DIPT